MATIRRRVRPRRAARRTARRSLPWHGGQRPGRSSPLSIACAAASSHSEIVRCGCLHASRGERLQLSSPRLGGELAERRLDCGVGHACPRRGSAQRVAGEPRLLAQRARPAEPGQHGGVVEHHPVRHRGAQPVAAIPALVDLDAVRVTEVDPNRQRRFAVGVAGQHQRAIQAAGAGAERLDAAQRLAAGRPPPPPRAAPRRGAGPRPRRPRAARRRGSPSSSWSRSSGGAWTSSRSTALRCPSKIRPTEPSARATCRTSSSSAAAGGRTLLGWAFHASAPARSSAAISRSGKRATGSWSRSGAVAAISSSASPR